MRDKSIASYFVGVDVGTAKVRCVVGSVDEQGVPEIIGHSEAESSGMRRGVVAHTDEVADIVTRVISDAERLSGRTIKSATVNVNGSHVEGMNSRGVIAISAANREVQEDDRARVEEAASVMKMPANREIIQVFPKAYRLDGQGDIKDPVGMQGVRLEVDTHIVTASVPSVSNLEQALEKAEVAIKHKTVSGLASAEAVMTRQQREAGTAVVDIGAGSTNIIVIEDGEVQHVAVIPVGGVHVTNDLAIGLKTDLDIAEEIKVQHASLVKTARSTVSVSINKEQHTFDADEVLMIIDARMEELMELIDKEFKKISRSKKLPGGVVFTGGGSKLNGLAEFAKEKLELPARQAKLLPLSGLSDIADDVTYATPIGLMLLDMLLDGQPNGSPEGVYNGAVGAMSKIVNRLKPKRK